MTRLPHRWRFDHLESTDTQSGRPGRYSWKNVEKRGSRFHASRKVHAMTGGQAVPDWARRLADLRRDRNWSAVDVAKKLKELREGLPAVQELAHMIRSDWETGRHKPGPRYRPLLMTLYGARDTDVFDEPPSRPALDVVDDQSGDGDEIDAFELGRRVAANDVSEETLLRLELAFEELAVSYASTPPAELLRP